MMDWKGLIILAGGAWAFSLPFVETYLIKRGRYLLAWLYFAPILWFIGGYVLSR